MTHASQHQQGTPPALPKEVAHDEAGGGEKEEAAAHLCDDTGGGNEGEAVHHSKIVGGEKERGARHLSEVAGGGREGDLVHLSEAAGGEKEGGEVVVHLVESAGGGKDGEDAHLNDDSDGKDIVPGVKDPVAEMLKEKKGKSRVKTKNLTLNTEQYLEKSTPENSKRNIQTAVRTFQAVLRELHPEEKREIKQLPCEILADYLEEFFMSVLKEDGTIYNASTLGTYYNNLARYFLEEKKINIKRDKEFVRVGKVLSRRQGESVQEGEIPGKNASKPIPKEVLVEVIAQGKIGTDNPKALTANVIQCFETGFGIRSRTEMYEIMNGDITVGPLKQNGVPEFIELGERLTKMRRGMRGHGITYKFSFLIVHFFPS